MAKGGTKIYCPGCKTFSVCRAISPTALGKPKAQRWHRTDYPDVSWFRRGRECLDCGHEFLSAEVDEAFLLELVKLSERLAAKQRECLAAKQKGIIKQFKRKTPWLKREETIPLEVAEKFIRETAWWLTHYSGNPVRAPRHANRIYKSNHGWAVEFGANTFLVGKAIERCRNTLNYYFDKVSKHNIPLKSEMINSLKHSLKQQISGAVANVDDNEYAGYPIDNDELVFGAQAINVDDAAKFMIRESGIGDLLLGD